MRSSRARSLLPTIAVLLAASVAAQTSNPPPPATNNSDSVDYVDAAHLPVCDPDHPDPTTEVLARCSADSAEYVRSIRLQVQRSWYSLISSDVWMKRACAVIDFTIRPDGGVSTLKIPRSAGDLQLDRAAVGGIVSAAPFPPAPAGCDRGLKVRFRLYYNPGPGRQAIPSPTSGADRTTAPDDEPIVHGPGIFPPALVYSPNSAHPPVVLNSPIDAEANIPGRVLLIAVVTSKGDVASVKIGRGAGNGVDENAMASVLMSKFKPATLAGIAVRTEVNLRVDLQ
jgi:TonB family protein